MQDKEKEKTKIVSSLPFGDILKLSGKLIRYSRGGISKEEGAELVSDLGKLLEELSDCLK